MTAHDDRPRDPIEECVGKVAHDTQMNALRHARLRGHGDPYRCSQCHNWYVGNDWRGKNSSRGRR